MTGIGFSLLAGALELIVPSYALRLLRRFGANYVGRFIVVAFCSLALFHLLALFGLPGGAFVSGFALDLWIAVGSVLLLVGMGHLETCLGERFRLRQEQQALRSQCELQLAKGTEDLAAANQNLLRQIARREQELKAIQQSEADYRFLFAENPQALWLQELGSGGFLEANHAALRLFGLSSQEFLTLTPRELLRPEQLAAFLEDAARPCPAIESRGIWRFCRKDGAALDLELTALDCTFSGQPTRLFLAQDCSQRRQREFEVAQDTLSRIAGGLATHLNPVFATIDQQSNLLRNQSQDLASVEQINRISEAAGRASAVTRELLLAGAGHALKTQPLDLNTFLQNLCNQKLVPLLGESIVLRNSSNSSLPMIEADLRLLEESILELALNARAAMPRGGALSLTATCIRLPHFARLHPRPSPTAEFVCLSVADTGPGLPPEVQAHLFEPFITTRSSDKAAGLGLASVHGAMKQQSGWVEVHTEAGAGTEVKLFFPALPPSPATVQAQSASAKSLLGATVIVVEPEERLRGVARFALTRQGCRVIEAESDDTVLLLWEKQAQKVDLLLTEVTLPGNSGLQLAAQLRQDKPDLQVLYTSVSNPQPGTQGSTEALSFLPKPYTPEKLLQAVQACLAEKQKLPAPRG